MKRSRRVFVLLSLTALVAAACTGLGIWQLKRLSARRAFNTLLLDRMSTLGAYEGLPATIRDSRDNPVAYRRIKIEGTYDVANEVVLRARSLDGAAGNHVLTPLVMESGNAIIVDRGWVPLEMNRAPVTQAPPPSGAVTVTGILTPAEPAPRFFGPRDPSSGRLRTIGRLDIERLSRQMPYRVERMALSLEKQEPPGAALPRIAALRPPGEGPHLSYAVQWFLFGAIAVITGVLLARRERRYTNVP